MGGLFSKNDEGEQRRLQEEQRRLQEERQRQERMSEYYKLQRIRQEEVRRRQEALRRAEVRREQDRRQIEPRTGAQRIYEGLRQERVFLRRLQQHQIRKDFNLLADLKRAFRLSPLYEFPRIPYEKEELEDNSWEYRKVMHDFRSTNKPDMFNVTKIVKVNNIFLRLHYKVAMDKMMEYDEEDYSEETMFHGTKLEYLDNICRLNFDRSKVKTHKFGWGLSFATNSFYATHYHHDNMRRMQKVMILAQVFYGDVELGDKDTIVPVEPCYTSVNEDESVFVKYDDASFYPAYIVHYEGMHPPKQRRYE